MQEEVGEDLLSLRLSIGGVYHFDQPTKKRKRIDDPNDKNLMLLLQTRDRMTQLSCNRHGMADEKGLQLVRLLLLCATAVDRNDRSSAADLLRQLYRNVSLSGSPIQRVTAYFTDGLMASFMSKNSSFYSSIMADPSPAEEFSAFTSFCLASPYYQFAHFTANQAIFEAFEEDEKWNSGCLHVIDFDVSYGLQWPSLIQSLSDKATNEKPINLLITGFGKSMEELKDTEKRLSSFASGFRNLFFKFEGRLRGGKGQGEIQVQKNSTVAVNLVFYLHSLKSYSDICTTLTQINELNPSVVTLVEKEGSRGNPNSFLSRFMESLQYFAAMFDSLDDCLPARNKERLRIEKNHLGTEIRHAVKDEEEKGCRYERLETWKAVMERYRFEGVRMSSRSVSQAKLLLKITSHSSAMDDHGTGTGFRIFERDEGNALSLGWQDTHLITATAWRRSS
ncbi:scarecrow-like protein 23 [Phalaenopsis equestris]|uniref:scarecrow-like protein 23 n=1 Tax=Phalaenopsis equestris TaxID=78828 RepID=UPI0009E3E6FF|nr:scarecrow-like protein 23 [Phalaenopsis equestris]